MKRPSKFRVLLAVNRWRIAHGKRPILRLPKGRQTSATSCPLTNALGVRAVVWGSDWGYEHGYCIPTRGGDNEPLTPLLSAFARNVDGGAYPELIA